MSYSIDMGKIIWRTAAIPADPDFALLQRIAEQDEDALEELYQTYASGLLAYLIGRLGEVHLAEDVLQEVMLAAWQYAPRFRGDCRVRTWLLTIARSRAINAYHRRVRPVDREVPLEAVDLDSTMGMPGRYSDLYAAIAALPVDQRETLELVFYHGLSLEETAYVQQVALGTIKSRLHRIKASLREWLKTGSEPDE